LIDDLDGWVMPQDVVLSLEPGFQLEAIQFEKDDDSNFHMDFIAGLANMRARNYTLQAVFAHACLPAFTSARFALLLVLTLRAAMQH
jgi:hypothetical protein